MIVQNIYLLETYITDKVYLEYLSALSSSSVIENEIAKTTAKLNEIEKSINQLKSPYKDILYMKYVQNYDYFKIARTLNYSTQRIFQLRKDAIELFSEAYSNVASK